MAGAEGPRRAGSARPPPPPAGRWRFCPAWAVLLPPSGGGGGAAFGPKGRTWPGPKAPAGRAPPARRPPRGTLALLPGLGGFAAPPGALALLPGLGGFAAPFGGGRRSARRAEHGRGQRPPPGGLRPPAAPPAGRWRFCPAWARSAAPFPPHGIGSRPLVYRRPKPEKPGPTPPGPGRHNRAAAG